MRTHLIALAIVAGVLALATSVDAQSAPPKNSAVRLTASAATVTFSAPVTLEGTVKGAKAGVMVTLERRAATDAAFVPAGTATTNDKGRFSFIDRPRVNMVYRASVTTNPAATSPEATTAVAPLVGLKVGDSTPRKGQRVRFRGTVRPQHDGRRVAIQRRRADGTWITVRTPLLRDAGSTYSRYSKRIRIRRSGTYRTVIGAHADHAEGVSRERTLTLG
jgi:hypothetical protein